MPTIAMVGAAVVGITCTDVLHIRYVCVRLLQTIRRQKGSVVVNHMVQDITSRCVGDPQEEAFFVTAKKVIAQWDSGQRAILLVWTTCALS